MRDEVVLIRYLNGFESFELPKYHTAGSSGVDLRANFLQSTRTKGVRMSPGSRDVITTGISLQMPLMYEGQVRSRSGLALKYGVVVLNSPGTIDSDFRGQVKILLVNFGTEDFVVKHGDRVAQLLITSVSRPKIVRAESLEASKRGKGGFGSTGVT